MAIKPLLALPEPTVGTRSEQGVRSEPEPGTTGNQLEIRALTRAVRRGDQTAFNRMYDLYSFRLYKYLIVLARGDENEAREVCQSVMIKLARRCKAFGSEPQFWAWLRTMAKNSFIDSFRARKRLDRLVSLDELPPAVPSTDEPAPRLSDRLEAALATLPPKERELILAAYVDERPLRELADEGGETYKAVESRLGRLRQKLREHLFQQLRHEDKP